MKKILVTITSLAALFMFLCCTAGYSAYEDYSCVQRCASDAQKRSASCGMDNRCVADVQQRLNRCISDCNGGRARQALP